MKRIEISSGEAYPVAFVRFEDEKRPDFDPFEPNGELGDVEADELRRVLAQYEYWQRRLMAALNKARGEEPPA